MPEQCVGADHARSHHRMHHPVPDISLQARDDQSEEMKESEQEQPQRAKQNHGGRYRSAQPKTTIDQIDIGRIEADQSGALGRRHGLGVRTSKREASSCRESPRPKGNSASNR